METSIRVVFAWLPLIPKDAEELFQHIEKKYKEKQNEELKGSPDKTGQDVFE